MVYINLWFFVLLRYVFGWCFIPTEGKANGADLEKDHPQILEAMQKAENVADKSLREPNPEMYIKALKQGISEAEQSRKDSGDGRRYLYMCHTLFSYQESKTIFFPILSFQSPLLWLFLLWP